jgi:hypothetical protein
LQKARTECALFLERRGAQVALKCGPSSRDQLDHQNDECEHQQNMNESAQGVAADKAEQPQDKEDYENCPEHNLPPENAAYLYNSRLDAALNAQVVREMQIHAGKIGCNYAKSISIGQFEAGDSANPAQARYSAAPNKRITGWRPGES